VCTEDRDTLSEPAASICSGGVAPTFIAGEICQCRLREPQIGEGMWVELYGECGEDFPDWGHFLGDSDTCHLKDVIKNRD